MPASVGSTRRPERSSSCVPRRFSSARTCRLTAGCVTPSRSAACEKLLRSTTAQKAASCRVSIRTPYLRSARALFARGEEHLHLVDLKRSSCALPQRLDQIGASRGLVVFEVHL